MRAFTATCALVTIALAAEACSSSDPAATPTSSPDTAVAAESGGGDTSTATETASDSSVADDSAKDTSVVPETATETAASETSDVGIGDSMVDTSPLLVEGCTLANFADKTAAGDSRTIAPWDPSLGKVCLKIKLGQSVSWTGVPTAAHPLAASGGSAGNPITDTSPIRFDNAGTFGWHCGVHSTSMFGAIWVVP